VRSTDVCDVREHCERTKLCGLLRYRPAAAATVGKACLIEKPEVSYCSLVADRSSGSESEAASGGVTVNQMSDVVSVIT